MTPGKLVAIEKDIRAGVAPLYVENLVAAFRASEAESARLREAVRWLAQTIHQAHHEGTTASCPKNTCAHARDVLEPR